MSVYGQGAPGVRIRLRDLSEVTLVSNPNITAGIVGYSAKGEFNKIIKLTSTADQDTYLGNGFNNARYNQGLYASRAVLNANGFVEYVRPYGETVITDDTDPDYDTNQALKTDTFTVAFNYADDAQTSFDIKHYASTRYIEDGLVGLGSRKINTITETLKNNSNVDFELSADAMDDDKKVMLFAIMNSDPTAAIRAGNRIAISNITGDGTDGTVVTVKVAGIHGLEEGDTVIITGTETTELDGTFIIDTVIDETTFTFAKATSQSAQVGIVYSNTDTINSGVDYLTVKTVATGSASKKYDSVSLSTTNLITTNNDGNTFTMETSTGTDATFEFTTNTAAEGNIPVSIVNDTFLTTVIQTTYTVTYVATPLTSIIVDSVSNINLGDKITITGTAPTGLVTGTVYTVSAINANAVSLSLNGVDVSITSSGSGDVTKVAHAVSVTNGSKFTVGDKVHVTGTPPTGLATGTVYTVSAISTNDVSLHLDGSAVNITTSGNGGIVNLTGVIRSFVTALSTCGYANSSNANSTVKSIISSVFTLNAAEASKFNVNDMVILNNNYTSQGTVTLLPSGLTAGTVYKIDTVNLMNNTITLKSYDNNALSITADISTDFKIINLSKGVVSASVNSNRLSLDIIGRFGLTSPAIIQTDAKSFFDFKSLDYISSTKVMDTDSHMIKTTEGSIVIDSTIGRQFLNLGLAVEDYQDINFDGTEDRVYQLTADGEIISKMYVYVTYYFAGETYQFSGTLIPYAYGDTNLYLKNSAEYYENGWTLVMNDNASLEDAQFISGELDLSSSIIDGIISSTITKVAFDETDPAIVNDAVWTYNPKNNASSSVLSSAWQLFLNKDESSCDMLVAAGTAISNLFVKNMEQINYTVMDSMLGICEKRKDMFAIFDGVDEPKIDVALKKMIGIGSVGDLSRWGSIFDGRSIFSDSVYTKINAPAVKSIEVAAIICYNRASNVYWLPPAGYTTGRIPSSLASRQKFIRTYNYADDATSDIARLYDANINPTRVNDQGQFIYGQKTMLKRMTALNRLNVIMLIAGIHKRFSNFLDKKVFQLNTAALRTSIQADLQAQLELIKSANPAGLTAGVVICDETNNTRDIIDTNQLIVDVVLQPTKSVEFITLRTTVQRTGDDLKITNSIIGG